MPLSVGAMSPGRPQNSSSSSTVRVLVPAAMVVLTAARETVAAQPTMQPLYPVLKLGFGCVCWCGNTYGLTRACMVSGVIKVMNQHMA